MQNNQFIVFKKNTDAPSAGRGFLYQYIKTLILWLTNYQNQVNNIIYCEVEDDIKELSQDKREVNFTQIKCYSTSFSFSSVEIKKSIYNFFQLFIAYEEFKGYFCFETNSSVTKSDELLIEWVNKQRRINDDKELLDRCVQKIQEILHGGFSEVRQSLIKSIDGKIETQRNKIGTSGNKKAEELISDYILERNSVELASKSMLQKIDDNEYVEEFTKRILWIFDNIESEHVVTKELEKADKLLQLIIGNKRTTLYLSRLLTEISLRSEKANKDERYLDNELLDEILKESAEEMRASSNIEILDSINSLSVDIKKLNASMEANFKKVNDGLENVIEKIDQSKITSIYPNDLPLDLPYAEADEIKEVINIEKRENKEFQSNLDYKFGKIEIKNLKQKKYYLEEATSLRCRYLIMLEKIKLENLNEKYQTLKKLESKVRRKCTKSVISIEDDENFNSKIFWESFENDLENLLEQFKNDRNINIDEDVIMGQMYQMAAECYLQWHKEED
jgi:hypothetical protein